MKPLDELRDRSDPTKVLEETKEIANKPRGRPLNENRDQTVNKEKRMQLIKNKKQKQLVTQKGDAIIQQKKIDAFFEEFLKNGGNATEAAVQVFNVTSRASASTLGSYYLKKCKMLGRVYLEKQGYSYGRLLSIAAQKAEESRLPDWWDRVMEVSDYGNFRVAKGGMMPVNNINIIQTEKELFKKYVMEGEVVEDEPEESVGYIEANESPKESDPL